MYFKAGGLKRQIFKFSHRLLCSNHFGLLTVVWTHQTGCCHTVSALAFPSTFHVLPLDFRCLTHWLSRFCSKISPSERFSLPTHCKILTTSLPKLSGPLPSFIFPLVPCCMLYLYGLIDLVFLPLEFKFHKSRNFAYFAH